jgi:hypothetical protein
MIRSCKPADLSEAFVSPFIDWEQLTVSLIKNAKLFCYLSFRSKFISQTFDFAHFFLYVCIEGFTVRLGSANIRPSSN